MPTRPLFAVELVPQACWLSHGRDHVSTAQGDRLRTQTYRQAHDRCEICGGCGSQWSVKCHDVWHDDDRTHVHTLLRLIVVCLACQVVKHLGVADIHGRLTEAQAHFTQVNAGTEAKKETYLAHVWTVGENRSQRPWTLALSWVEAFGRVVPSQRVIGRMRARRRHVGSTQWSVKSSPGVLKPSGAQSGAGAPQKGMTRHPSPLGMEIGKVQ